MSSTATHSSLNEAHHRLRQTLAERGWDVHRAGWGLRARWESLTVDLVPIHDGEPDGSWRARMLEDDVVEREHVAWDPAGALEPVIAHALTAASFHRGDAGLVSNRSRGWLGGRLWHAVRASDGA